MEMRILLLIEIVRTALGEDSFNPNNPTLQLLKPRLCIRAKPLPTSPCQGSSWCRSPPDKGELEGVSGRILPNG